MSSVMTDEDRKEELHKAYVHALAAKLGYLVVKSEKDYGVDGYLYQVQNGISKSKFPTKVPLSYQLKASSSKSKYQIKEEFVHFTLDSDAYNKLVDMYSDEQDCILIIFCMPEDEKEWVDLKEEELIIRRCCYWDIIRETTYIKQNSSKTIKIPRTQILDESTLVEMMEEVNKGTRL